jgi:hypothetical protein
MADDRYVRQILDDMRVTDSEIDEAIRFVMTSPCGIMCLTRSTLEDGIKKATDPDMKNKLRMHALERILVEIFGENYEKALVMWTLTDMEQYMLERMEEYLRN